MFPCKKYRVCRSKGCKVAIHHTMRMIHTQLESNLGWMVWLGPVADFVVSDMLTFFCKFKANIVMHMQPVFGRIFLLVYFNPPSGWLSQFCQCWPNWLIITLLRWWILFSIWKDCQKKFSRFPKNALSLSESPIHRLWLFIRFLLSLLCLIMLCSYIPYSRH